MYPQSGDRQDYARARVKVRNVCLAKGKISRLKEINFS